MEQMLLEHCSQILYISLLVSGNYVRDIDFVNNVTIALSSEEMTKIKVLHLDKLCNFIVEHF